MVGGVAEHRVFAHPRRRQRQRRAVPDAAKRGNGTPAFAGGKAAPDFGPGAVGLQVVHIDALLRQKGQHVLRCADQFGRAAILQRQTQGAEAVLVFGAFGKVQGADEIPDRQGFAHLVGRGAQGQGRLL